MKKKDLTNTGSQDAEAEAAERLGVSAPRMKRGSRISSRFWTRFMDIEGKALTAFTLGMGKMAGKEKRKVFQT